MRIVAIVLVSLFLVPALAGAFPGDGTRYGEQTDQCDNRLYTQGSKASCLRYDAGPSAASGKLGERYFLWLDPMECGAAVPTCVRIALPLSDNAITGLPGLVAVLYGDTNGINGLQRNHILNRPPDNLILV